MAAHVGLTGCANESGRRQHPVTSRWPSGHVLCCGLMPHLRQEKWKESSERSGRPTLELKRSSLRHPMGAASLIASSTPLYAPPSITSKSPGPCFAVHVPTTTSPYHTEAEDRPPLHTEQDEYRTDQTEHAIVPRRSLAHHLCPRIKWAGKQAGRVTRCLYDRTRKWASLAGPLVHGPGE